jgi:Outer membrane protein beta-barrel domain
VTVQVELLYSGQGGTFHDLTTGETSERRLHYLNPAFLLRYTPSESYSLLGGLHLGVLIVAREGSVNISDDYDPMDLGLHLGFEYNVTDRLGFSSRFLQSLRNIGNQVLQVSVVVTIQESKYWANEKGAPGGNAGRSLILWFLLLHPDCGNLSPPQGCGGQVVGARMNWFQSQMMA